MLLLTLLQHMTLLLQAYTKKCYNYQRMPCEEKYPFLPLLSISDTSQSELSVSSCMRKEQLRRSQSTYIDKQQFAATK